MQKEVARSSVEYLQVLNEEGRADEKLMHFLSKEQIKRMYELMVLTRAFDDKAIKLQRQGRLGTYASVRGQEACQIPSAMLMEEDDLAFPAFREHGVYLTRGAPPEMLLQYWGGDERGMHLPEEVNIFPVCIPVSTHLPHAVGAAMAFSYLKKNAVSVAYFGDGATSKGDFHEAMNFAGVFNAPVVFICQNNQWAISTPVKEQTASATLAQKALAYGFEGVRVDGNDVFAVYKATFNALKKARSGKGPTFIECFTYRLSDHTTSDDATKYRSEAEVKTWEKKDPIARLQKYLLKKKIANDSYFQEMQRKAEQIITDAVTKYENIPAAPVEDLFNYAFAKLPPELQEQLAQAKKEVQ